MTPKQKIELLLICHTVQKHKHEDISCIVKIRKMTANDLRKVNKKLGIYKPEMKIVKVVNY